MKGEQQQPESLRQAPHVTAIKLAAAAMMLTFGGPAWQGGSRLLETGWHTEIDG
jgi:hypothetical protein